MTSSCPLGSAASSRGSPDSSNGNSWRHQLHPEAQQDTLLQRGHQHPLLQVRLIMTSSAPRGSAAGRAATARSPAPPTPGMANYDVVRFSPEVAWPKAAVRSPAPFTPVTVIHDVIDRKSCSGSVHICLHLTVPWTRLIKKPLVFFIFFIGKCLYWLRWLPLEMDCAYFDINE